MPPSVSITLFEKVTYLRGQSASNDARGGFRNRRNVLDQDAQPSQLRGLVTLHLPKPTRIKSVELTLTGQGRTDWPEGIGNNRVELAETTHFFKEQIILFDAKAEAAPSPPLRRSHSVGPGIGLTDDVDWGMIGGSHPCPDDRALSKAFQSKSGKSDKDAAAQFARSAGKFAAKAGTAILPPTLLREFAASKPDKQAAGASTSKKPKNQQQPRSGPVSPILARFPQMQLDPPPPVYVATPPAESTLSPPDGSYFNLRRPTSSSPSTPSPLHSPQLGPPPLSPALPPQSISAAGPHGRSILQTPRRNRAQAQQEQSSLTSESPTTSTAASADHLAVSPDTAIRLAIPAAQRAQPGSVNMVRFDSGEPTVNAIPPLSPAIDAAAALQAGAARPIPFEGRRGSSASDAGLDDPQSASLPAATASAPASRRTSVDFASVYTPSHTGKTSTKGKGKARETGQSHKLPGLKDILGGLRRDEGHSKQGKDGAKSSTGKSQKNSSGSRSPVRSRRSTDASSAAAFASAQASQGSTSTNAAASQSIHAPHVAPQYKPAPQTDWREFKKGTYTYSISLPLPANLPPTLHADFGRNTYTLRANVRRSGPLTSNLTCEREVVLVHAPDEEGTEETEAVVVERTWEDALTYRVFVSGRSFACGSTMPLWMKFIPLGEKIKLWRVTVTLEERTHYYAKQRKVSRHETPRRTVLLKVIDPDGKPLLPIFSDSPDALASSQLGQYVIAAAGLNVPPEMRNNGSTSQADSSDEGEENEEVRQDALATLLDPSGPWELAMNIQLPGKDSRVNISTDHEKSCITVSHSLRLVFRVERVINGAPKLYDIVIEAPIKINHSHTAEAWLSLPNYWSVASTSSPLDAGGAAGDYFSEDHHGGRSQHTSSSSSRTPSWYAPSTAPVTPVGHPASSSSSRTATAATATPVNTTPAQTPIPIARREPPSPPAGTSGAVTSPATSPLPASAPTTQSTADEWLALSIARNETAGRTDRMVTFADGASELPPPYDSVSSTGVSQRS